VDYFLNADSRQGMQPMMNEYDKEIPISRDYLTIGEHVLWKGRPGKGRLLSKIDIFLIPFSIVRCGFVFF